jgi:two-component system chemotaxis family response regulator WspR
VTERKVLEEQLATVNRELSLLARQDGLTALANRRRFDEALHQEHDRAARNSQNLGVILLDVDCFKLFNDTYGHPAGDRCLQAVAAAIESALHRPQDLAARYGGEEFAILMPETDEEGAERVARRIQAAIRDSALPHSGSPCGTVTVSMGVAVAAPRPRMDPADLIRQADAALYRAKRDGRDRICWGLEPAAAEGA